MNGDFRIFFGIFMGSFKDFSGLFWIPEEKMRIFHESGKANADFLGFLGSFQDSGSDVLASEDLLRAILENP